MNRRFLILIGLIFSHTALAQEDLETPVIGLSLPATAPEFSFTTLNQDEVPTFWGEGEKPVWQSEDLRVDWEKMIATQNREFLITGNSKQAHSDILLWFLNKEEEVDMIVALEAEERNQEEQQKRVFYLKEESRHSKNQNFLVSSLAEIFQNEPTIQEVQEQAMRFADAHPEKIRKWKRGVKWRALMPKLQLGLDGDRYRGDDHTFYAREEIEDSQEMTWDEDVITAVSFKGKRQIPVYKESLDFRQEREFKFEEYQQRDRKRGFVIGAVWDLGDFIFNPDQINISKEVRQIVALRDTLLKEVTQTYFRRKYLKIDLFSVNQEPPPEDEKERLEWQSRKIHLGIELEELTAQLDALTGGWYSKQLGSRDKKF